MIATPKSEAQYSGENMNRFSILIFLLAIVVGGCSSAFTPAPTAVLPSTPVSRTLNVFAAASLTNAFTELGKNFEAANPHVTVIFNFAGSQALRAQIEEGAPADVFASASGKEMDMLVSEALVTESAPQIFLNNWLVVILSVDNPAGLQSLEHLANPGVKLVLADDEVPVGNYTRQSLDLMNGSFGADFKDKVLANLVSNEDNARQVVAKVQLGEADAGIVYTSDAVAAPGLQTIEIPTALNVVAQYPIASLVNSANADLAEAFITYVLSPDGQALLQKWGFASTQ